MSRKLKVAKVPVDMNSKKLEAVVRQIERVRNGDKLKSFTVRELEAMRDELLVEING